MTTAVTPRSATAWYDSPLYYDMVYEDYTQRETRFLRAAIKKYGVGFTQRWKVLEPACGSGRLVESLAQLGHDVHGFDLNINQVAYAQKRVRKLKLPAQVWCDSLQNFKAPDMGEYDLAHCFVSTFKYLLKEKDAVAALRGFSLRLFPSSSPSSAKNPPKTPAPNSLRPSNTWPASSATSPLTGGLTRRSTRR